MSLPLRGSLDLPAPGAVIDGPHLRAGGWALCGDRPASMVVVSVNGRVHAVTVPHEERPDVGQALLGGKVARCGWNLVLDVGDEPLGDAVVTAVIIGGDSSCGLEPANVVLVRTPIADAKISDELRFFLDVPSPGDVVPRDFVTVAGWANAWGDPVGSVDILVDGVHQGLARIACPRKDVDEQLPGTAALLAGFVHEVDLGHCPEDSEKVSIEAHVTTLGGKSTVLGPVTVALEAPSPPPGPVSARVRTLRSRTSELFGRLPAPPIRPLHLLAITHSLTLGGGQLYLQELLEKMGAGRDFRCSALALEGGPLLGGLEAMGIPTRLLRGFPLHDIEAYETTLTALGLWAADLGANAVLVNTMGAFFGADLAKRLGLPVVWAIHESYVPRAFWRAGYPLGWVDANVRRRGEEVLREADITVFESAATQQLYAPYVTASRSRLIPYGIDLDQIDAYLSGNSKDVARRRLGLPAGAKVVLCMGTTEPRKSQTMLMQAFSSLMDDHSDAVLVLVGLVDTPYGAAVSRLVAANGLSGRVRLVPPVTDTFEWYLSADLMVSASDVESLPRSALEAMAFGVPVLASDVFGLPELITDGATGYLCPPRDLGALIHHLDRVLSMPEEERRTVAAAGADLVRRRHDSRGYAEAYRDLFDGFLQGRD